MKTFLSLNKASARVGERVKIENPYITAVYRRIDRRSALSRRRAANGENTKWYQEKAIVLGS